jgi:outer membrane lipoprotein SlyB
MPLSEVAIARRMAKIAKNSTDPNEARLGGIMVRHLNDYLKGLELSPGAIIKGSAKGIGGKLNKADRMWQQQKNSEAIEKVIAKAEDSGGNFANALKTGIRGLLRKDIDAGGRLYTIEEKAALRKVLNGTITSKTVSSLRRLVPTSIGSFGPSAMAGYAGSSMLGPWTLPVQAAIGAAAIPATNAMARNAVNAARAVAVGAGRGTKATAGGRSSQITPKMGPLPATRMSHGLGRAGLGQALLNMQQSQALPPEVPLAAGGTEDDLRKQQRINWLKKSGQPWT